MLDGDLDALKANVMNDPSLVDQRSQYGHRASLLNYAGSNGVGFWRQKVPHNLPKIVSYLLENGADKNAKMKVHGGAFTTLELLETSDHPYNAGLSADLREVLCG